MWNRTKAAFSLVEVVIAVGIFTAALIPVLYFALSSNRGAYSLNKHMMAGQIAASVIDRYLGLPYDEARRQILATTGPQPVVGAAGAAGEAGALVPGDGAGARALVEADLPRLFRSFRYEVGLEDGDGDEEGRLFTIVVRVSWLMLEEDERTREHLLLRAIKHHEQPPPPAP